MANMKNLLMTCIMLFFVGSSFGQKDTKEIILYKTIEDLKNSHGEKIGKLNGYSTGIGHMLLKVENGKRSVSIMNYWGFTVDSSLYRVSKTDIVRVISVGKIVYYENGFANLRGILSDDGSGWVSNEAVYFYSSTLTSKIFSSLKKFSKSLENPDASTLKVIDGLKEAYKIKGWNNQINAVRKCIMDLN